ncbi:PepSY domain-containing protein [Latilactobacillus curvatus]|uniref:PepSY domain-containing protein n=1 Tax=Latilactobacillus curvatus TaxID=28038 RepID=UPI000DAADF2E|nr:PepSY domain-containing protein [Latilactobacillus curvatus]AWV73594.1 hypothetical protein C0W45_08790 [Latilactobacillus curvatus]MCP8849489.1 PepSY domain-containing protein [Latilactobacillus curvatus]MDG2984779.1 PepSY domain-containing protein [Latilactobacillus curvatus]
MRKTTIIVSLVTLGLLTGCTANQTKHSAPPAQKESTSPQQTVQAPKVTLEKARELYAKQYPASDLTEVELKQWGNQMFYELTGMNDNEELHMHVDARTGVTSRLSKEALDADEQNGVERHQKQLAFDQLLTPQQALQKAQQYFTGNVIKWSLEKDDGRTVWEVEGHQKQQKMQVKLDAETGALLEKEMDD